MLARALTYFFTNLITNLIVKKFAKNKFLQNRKFIFIGDEQYTIIYYLLGFALLSNILLIIIVNHPKPFFELLIIFAIILFCKYRLIVLVNLFSFIASLSALLFNIYYFQEINIPLPGPAVVLMVGISGSLIWVWALSLSIINDNSMKRKTRKDFQDHIKSLDLVENEKRAYEEFYDRSKEKSRE